MRISLGTAVYDSPCFLIAARCDLWYYNTRVVEVQSTKQSVGIIKKDIR